MVHFNYVNPAQLTHKPFISSGFHPAILINSSLYFDFSEVIDLKKIVMFAGLLAAPVGFSHDHSTSSSTPQKDPRFARLRNFFRSQNCPLSQFADDFVIAADENHLDWRLLPSISMLESGGGRNYRNANVLGWASARGHFSSVRAGIHAVAFHLGNSRLYRHKKTDEILRIYNPRPEYATRVKLWMQALSRV